MNDSTKGKTPEPKKKKTGTVAKKTTKKKTTKRKAPKQTPGVKAGYSTDFTEKQLAFIDFYVACRNATKAAREAGYAEKSASVTGHQLLAQPKIQNEVRKRQDALRRDTQLTPENIIAKLKEFIYERPGTKDSDVLKALGLAGSYFGMWDGLGKPENGQTNRRDALARFRALLGKTE